MKITGSFTSRVFGTSGAERHPDAFSRECMVQVESVKRESSQIGYAIRYALCAMLLLISCDPQERVIDEHADVTVTVDRSTPDMVSNFEIGLTHVHTQWDRGHPGAVARVKSRLAEAIRFHNQHITHWGVDENLMPGPGEYDWESLDHRMDLIRSIDNSVPVITFCGAPAWMKDHDPDAQWQVEVRPRDENVPDFASLCKTVALRYPDVEVFQIWNEFKGYRSWNNGVETKDIERFTAMYNAVYDSVKAVQPDVKIGGLYMPMGGRDVNDHDREVIGYWQDHGSGADIFTYDGWLEGWPPGGNTEEWMMGRTGFFGDLTDQFAALTDLPVWISEFYAGRNESEEFTAANHASSYYHSLKRGTHMVLLWDAFGLGRLFSGTDTADGGQPTPHYFVVRAFNRHFGPGTQLYRSESSSEDLEMLASQEKVLLINKRPDSVSVNININDEELSLRGYEVWIGPAP